MAADLDQAWNIVTNLLLQDKDPPPDDVIHQALEILDVNEMTPIIQPWFFEMVQQHLRSQVAPEFWGHFERPVPVMDVIPYMKSVFDGMYLKLSTYWSSLERLDIIQKCLLGAAGKMEQESLPREDPRQKLILYFKAILFPLFPKNTKHFQDAIHKFYSKAFKAFDAITKTSDDIENEDELETESLTCEGCDLEHEECKCQEIMSAFRHLNHQLRDLGLLDRLCGEVVSSLIHLRIQQHLENTCKGNFETHFLETLESWLDTKVVGWLELLYGDSYPRNSESTSNIQAHKDRLVHYMYETYATIHVQQMFTIIIDYPESMPALQDLKVCMEKVNLRGMLVRSLKQALETRLLHPGVNTSDIITAYVNAIRALKVLDPSGVLLDLVCEPVRRYLRSREDTVRCVVSNLTEDSSSELSEELLKNQAVIHDDSLHSDDDTDDWENWQPDPVDADPGKSSGSRRSSDIISMLINIYGSKELFVNEYQTILADRILTHFNYDTEKELRYLELLKVKFGEAQLHYCEVMLKDVGDSRRINARIFDQREKEKKQAQSQVAEGVDGNSQEQQQADLTLSSLILSAEFWPAFREEKLKLPEFMDAHMEKYTKGFEGLKGNRTLCWKSHLGQVTMEIEHKGKSLELTVSPVHATIIWYFQEKPKWTLEELSTVMQTPSHALRRKMAFWQSHGLLKEETTDVFVLVEEVKGQSHDTVVMEEEEVESAMATAQDKKEEELNVIWQYVVGMLTNLDSLPLERIHSMLKMFAMQGPGSDCSIHQLKGFLDKKVKEQKLLFSMGVYRLSKPGT